jgi:hypothetical protein
MSHSSSSGKNCTVNVTPREPVTCQSPIGREITPMDGVDFLVGAITQLRRHDLERDNLLLVFLVVLFYESVPPEEDLPAHRFFSLIFVLFLKLVLTTQSVNREKRFAVESHFVFVPLVRKQQQVAHRQTVSIIFQSVVMHFHPLCGVNTRI